MGERPSSGHVKVKGGFRLESHVKILKQNMFGYQQVRAGPY
jgi:hypothetical protein